MSLKKPLVKQRVIRAPSFEGHSLDDDEDDDDVKDKRQTTLPRKRVSFGFERQVIDASDSDEENSLGRHNRPLDKGEGFDKLFRSSGEGPDDVSAKNEIVQKSREKRKGEPPRPVPRRHTGSIVEQPSEENGDRDGNAARPIRHEKPVPHLRSPRLRPSDDTKEVTEPKPRPRLSPRGGSPRLGASGEQVSDMIDGPKERPIIPRRKHYGEEKSNPQIPMIRTSLYTDDVESYKEAQEMNTEYRVRDLSKKKPAIPLFELSESSDEEEEVGLIQKIQSRTEGRRNLAKDGVERETSAKAPKPSPRSHLQSAGTSKGRDLLGESGSTQQKRSLTRDTPSSQMNSTIEEKRTPVRRTNSPTKTDFEYGRTPEQSRSAKATKENDLKEGVDYETAQSKNKFRRRSSEGDFEYERAYDTNRFTRGGLKGDFELEASPGRSKGAARKLSKTADGDFQLEKSKPGRGTSPMQRSSSFEAKSTSMQRKAAGGEWDSVSQRKSPLPRRPGSAKKIHQRRAESDITATFEEHAPQQDNVIEVDDGVQEQRKFSRRPNSSSREPGSMKPLAGSTPTRVGPMKASRGIEEMTRSPHLIKEFRTQRQNETDSSPSQPLGHKRASSMTNLTGRTPSPVNYDSDVWHNSLDTSTIRQAVFDDWMSKKNERLKKELAKKTAAKKKQEEKKKEEHFEKTEGAKKAFQSWNEKKSGTLKDQQAKLKQEKKKEEEKELEKHIKKRDSKKYFESWKEKKDEELKEMHRKKKKEEESKKKMEKQETQEKVQSASKVYENWKMKKDEKLKQELKEKRKKERTEAEKKEDEEYEKSIERADKLETWKQKKGTPRKGTPPPTLTQRAWCPGSRNRGDCIPTKVNPVIQSPTPNRSRTLSGSGRLESSKYNY